MAWSDPFRYDKYLFIHAAPTVFAARVDQGSFTYPLSQVTFDTVTAGAFGDILPGMTVLFGSTAGASDLGRQRMRTAATSTVLFIGWSSRGIRDGEVNLADDAYITVLDDYRAWAKIPRITDDGTLFKDFNFGAALGTPSPPVANGGVGALQFVDDVTGLITVDFDGTNSFATAAGASIVSYTWDFGDGTPSSSLSSAPSGVTFPQGFRWVSLRVIDSNTKQHTTRIPVAALGDVGNEASYAGASYAASTVEAPHVASRAFDGSTATRWQTTDGFTTGWIEITLPSEITIAAYRLISDSLNLSKIPVDWTLKIGSGLATVNTQSSVSWSASETKQFNLASPVTSTIFRIDVTLNNGGNNVAIPEIELLLEEKNYFTKFEVTTQTLTRNGQTFGVTIHEDIPADTYYDGALMMYGEDEYYNDVKGSLAGPAGRENGKYIGWHALDPAALTASESTYITTTDFSCDDIGARMRKLPAFPQAVLRDASPTTWLQLAGANTDRYVHYLLHWHSTVLEVTPYTDSGTGDTYALPRFQSPGQNLFEQIAFRAASIAHELTITMRGQLGLTPDPQLQDPGDRTNTVITDIDPSDWGPGINYTHQRPPRTYWLWGNSVVANTQEADASDLKINAVFCVSPGKAPGQGETEQTQGEQLVVDQDELNARTGHQYARLNAFNSLFDTAIVHPGDIGIDPALMEWVRQTIPSELASQRGLTLTDERLLPFELDIVHNNITQTKEQFLRAEQETEGTPAATVIPETGDVLPDTPDIDEWPWIWEDEEGPGLFRGQATIAAFDDSALLHITTDFNTPEASGGPTWATTDLTGLSPALAGTMLSMIGDPFSPKYLGTGTTVNGWILTDTSIYSITDVFGVSGGPTLALQHTLATANAQWGFIATGVGVQNWAVAGVHYNTAAVGTKCIFTTDGATWTEAVVSAHYDNVASDIGLVPPIFVSSSQAGLVYMGAFTATEHNPPGGLFKSTDFGATWAAATDIAVSFGELNGGTFVIPWHDNAGQLLSYWTKDFEPDVPDGLDISLGRTEADGTTITDITPAGSDWGARAWWGLSVCPIDRQRVALAGFQKGAQPNTAIWVSKDAGDTWTQVTSIVAAGSESLTGIAIAGNDTDVIYAWGTDLHIIYSQDFGQTWENKTTKLAGAANILVLIGG